MPRRSRRRPPTRILLALVLLPSAALAQDKDPVLRTSTFRSAECRNADVQRVAGKAQTPVKPGTLAEQPLADQYLTVLRIEGGCDKPIKVRQGIGDSVER